MNNRLKNICLATAMLSLGLAAAAQDIRIENRTLMVDGKPFVMLSGELHNSTASSAAYMRENHVFDRLRAMNLNSVIATASWEIVEPEEGRFDFALVDTLIANARERDMRLALIWFGFQKNPFNTYAPSWVKRDPRRFPRARNEQGDDLQLPSVFSDNLLRAETRAFEAFMQHIRDVDSREHTVVMIQVENEPGIRNTPRDYSDAANKAYAGQVPAQLTQYLKKNAATLQPELKKAWEANGSKTQGTWEELFGKGIREGKPVETFLNLPEGMFTAWSYARYINSLAEAGKRVYNLPMFVNASVFGLNMKGLSLGNGCSIDDYFDIYCAGAPSIDVLAPNCYHPRLNDIVEVYSWKGNPLLIPESSLFAARALFAVGEHAICFAPFGIDAYASETNPREEKLLGEAYAALEAMGPLVGGNGGGSEDMRGVYLYNGRETQTLTMGDYELTFNHVKSFDINVLMAQANGVDSIAGAKEEPFQAGAVVIRKGDTFYITGTGVNADIKLRDGVRHRYCDYDEIREGRFVDGKFVEGRLLNGDERNVLLGNDSVGSLRVKMYHY